jgi:UPF0716 protein FxsA
VNKSKWAAYLFAGWLAVEIVAFLLVVQFVGLLLAIALGVATTLIGLTDVKRLFAYVKSRLAQPKGEAKKNGLLLDGGLQALGALLLILPGFASDLVGLALKAPSIRATVVERLRNGPSRTGPQTIDLAPNEWKALGQRAKRRTPVAKARPQ